MLRLLLLFLLLPIQRLLYTITSTTTTTTTTITFTTSTTRLLPQGSARVVLLGQYFCKCYYYYYYYYYYYDKFFLVGWSQLQCFYQVPRGKNFSFGWGPGLGSIALACHGFASAGAVTLGSALSPLLPPLGMFPVDTPMTMPWPSQEWLHHHSQSHGALSHSNPQPNAVGPQQYVWMCEKKNAGWKVFLHQT